MTTSATIISAVETTVLHVPRTPVKSAIGAYDGIGVVAVRLHTKDGPVGLGWTNVIGTGAETIKVFLDNEYAPLVEGRDAFQVRALWTEMFMHAISRGRKGITMYALSALDIALWDVVTQFAGLPLHRYLGAVRDSVPVYGDGCWTSLSLDELEAEAKRYHNMGLVGVKVKIGGRDRIKEDLERIDAVRAIIGDDRHLLIDANQAYDPLSAERVARALADRDVFWFEEPLLADSVSDYARLARTSPVAIACGENEYSRYGFRDLIEQKAVHILQPDVHRCGGITEFMRILALADAFNLPVAPHTSFELHSQILASSTTALMVEYYDWFPQGFFTEDFDVDGGELTVRQSPGIGARFNPDVLTEYAVRS